MLSWFPALISSETLLHGLADCPPGQRTATFIAAFVLSGFVAPIVEEWYFRGFLLPRMERWGLAAPAVNSLLFAMYHFFFPWNVASIFIAFLPIAYVTWIRKNWRIGAIAHCMLNLTGIIQLFLRFG